MDLGDRHEKLKNAPQINGWPCIVHQTWKSEQLPRKFEVWRESWKRFHPDWIHVLWTDSDIQNFITSRFPNYQKLFRDFDQNIKRVDAVRYFWLMEYGGIYADLDFECLRSFNPLLEQKQSQEVIVGQMGDDAEFVGSIPNALMISKRGVHFWQTVIDEMQASVSAGGDSASPEVLTGPVLLKRSVDKYPDRQKVAVLAPELFYSITWNGCPFGELQYSIVKTDKLLTPEESKALFPNSYAVTYWTRSWGEDNNWID